MKILVAPDSFKKAQNSVQVAKSIGKGLSKHLLKKEITLLPLTDGGDGFLSALYNDKSTIKRYVMIKTKEITKKIPYLLSDDLKKVFIESATCVGFDVFDNDILHRNSYLLGLLIKKLIKKGHKNFVIGLGGSATNDLGLGIIAALGGVFYDKNENILQPIPENLPEIDFIDLSLFYRELTTTNFTVLCDVDNPLTGENGAAYIYAKQKGASSKDVEFLDKSAKKFLSQLEKLFGWNFENQKMLGAAGGLGFAFKYFFNAKLVSGFDYFYKMINLENHIKNSNFVITSEGKFDFQSYRGKVVGKVIELCDNYNVPYIVLTGNAPEIPKNDLKVIDISSLSFNLDYSIDNTKALLTYYSRIIAYLLKTGGKI